MTCMRELTTLAVLEMRRVLTRLAQRAELPTGCAAVAAVAEAVVAGVAAGDGCGEVAGFGSAFGAGVAVWGCGRGSDCLVDQGPEHVALLGCEWPVAGGCFHAGARLARAQPRQGRRPTP